MSLYPILQTPILEKKRKKTLLLAQLERAVFTRLPVLGKIYERSGSLSLLEFTKKQFYSQAADLVAEDKKNEVIAEIKKETVKQLGQEAGERIEKQLRRNYLINTADHHGPLTYQNFVTSNFLTHFTFENPEEPYDMLILACANISFDTSSFPRGHMFHVDKDGKVEQHQLPFFSRKVRPLTVSGHEAYTVESLTVLKQKIEAMIREGLLQKNYADKINALIDEVYADPSVLSSKTFSEQITKTNYLLWKKIIGESSSNLIYLEQEKIVNNLIVANHLDQKTIINRILFDESVFNTFIKYFDGVSKGFDTTVQHGTYLFWGTPKDQKYRVQLWKEGNKLVAPDGSFSVDLTPAGIRKAIEAGELLPSTLLSFILLSFYYGLLLVGGRYQTTYLTKMKIAYELFCDEIGLSTSALPETDNQIMTFASIALMTDKSGNVISANGLDLLLYGTDYKNVIKSMVHTTTVAQAIARNLPLVYRTIIPAEKQTEELLSLTSDDIDRMTNFANTIKFSGTIA